MGVRALLGSELGTGGNQTAPGFPAPEAALISLAALPEVQQICSHSYRPGRAGRTAMPSSPSRMPARSRRLSRLPLAWARAMALSPRADFPALESRLFEFFVLAWSKINVPSLAGALHGGFLVPGGLQCSPGAI